MTAIGTLTARVSLPSRLRDALLASALVVIAGAHAWQAVPIDHHAEERAHAMEAVQSIRERINAAPPGADVYIDNERFRGVPALLIHRPDLFPGLAGVFALYFPQPVVDGRRVFFVIWDRDTLVAAKHGRKTGSFVVGPGGRAKQERVPADGPP